MKFNKILVVLTFVLAMSFFLQYSGFSKSITKDSRARMRIPGVLSFRIENANCIENPSGLEMEDIYDKGLYEFKNQPELTLRANTSWILTVKTGEIIAPEGVIKTSQDFKIKHNQSQYSDGGFYGDYKSLSGTDVIASGQSKLPMATFVMNYAMIVNEQTDVPGDYGVTLTYTFTSPS